MYFYSVGKIIENVAIEAYAAKGKAIARIDGKVVFVKGAVPGDIATINIYKKRRKYEEAEIITLESASGDRVDPICTHFGVCGGCKWQHLNYDKQLAYKTHEILDHFKRLGGIQPQKAYPIIACDQPFEYRNKMEFSFSSLRWIEKKEDLLKDTSTSGALGFHVPGRFDKIVQINQCHLQAELQNKIRSFIYTYALEHHISFHNIKKHQGLLRNLVLKNTQDNKWMVILVVFEHPPKIINTLLTELYEKVEAIVSVYYMVNPKKNDALFDLQATHYKGEKHLIETLDTKHFLIGPNSFFQVNPKQTINLYNAIKTLCNFKGSEVVYDLYCGAGTISNYIAQEVKQVIGIEYVEEATQQAKTNDQLNKTENCTYVHGDLAAVLTDDFIEQYGSPDLVITDPPRAGMHPKVIAQLLKIRAPKIIYVSCNSATQARDIALLKDVYDLISIQPVDMFPQTHHVENIAELHLKP